MQITIKLPIIPTTKNKHMNIVFGSSSSISNSSLAIKESDVISISRWNPILSGLNVFYKQKQIAQEGDRIWQLEITWVIFDCLIF